ncbi:MAG: hypothetical protein DWQ40_08890 [Actinobacteria bacterium]|nr:MAG: hypothetical protein DWQ40_08890 [Actinomycetota bacterium]
MTPKLNPSRSAQRLSGVAAGLGLCIGAALGYIVATIFSGTDAGDGLAFAAVLIPFLVTGAVIGWVAVPALVGRLLGWEDVGIVAAYQVMLGAIAFPASIWILGNMARSSDVVFAWTAGIVFIGVGVGVPALARVLAVPRDLLAGSRKLSLK